MDQIFIGHQRKDGTTQTLKDHLLGVASKASLMADEFGLSEQAFFLGLLHDLGKYSQPAQKRMRGLGEKVDHSTAGAHLVSSVYGNNFICRLFGWIIASHHSGLLNYGSPNDGPDVGTFCSRLKKKIPDYSAYRTEIGIPALPDIPCPDDIEADEEAYNYLSFMMRMLFSCLVDADFLDTEAFMSNGRIQRYTGKPIEELNLLFDQRVNKMNYLDDFHPETINGRRARILKQCIRQGETTSPGFYRLTVPTGGGKTLSSLGFALKHARKNGMKRIIYVIPYTSIIDQTANTYKKIFGDDTVLECHSSVDWSNQADEDEYQLFQLASENWDFSLILTTSVQFFESLYANRVSRCRKIHNISNSVIIFDEIQTLPVEYLKPCTEALYQLTNYYHCSCVFCSATQPAIDRYLSPKSKIPEIIPDMQSLYEFFQRVQFKDLGTISMEILRNQVMSEHQALVIFNTRKEASEFCKSIGPLRDQVYHLSTNMYPSHRKRVLANVQERLKSGKRCILVSTSIVEAGIDLDFLRVFREINGLDSILQAAGRCNREGRLERADSIVAIFRLQDFDIPSSQKTKTEITQSLLLEKKKLEDPDTIKDFFNRYYLITDSNQDINKILNCFSTEFFAFADAAKNFHFIEQNTVSLIVPCNESREIIEKILSGKISLEIMRKAFLYAVQIDRSLMMSLLKKKDIQTVEGIDLSILRNADLYDEQTGLNIQKARFA